MSRRQLFLVVVPALVTQREMKNYIHVAIAQWAKGGDPDHPLFDLDARDVRVQTAGQLDDGRRER